MPFKKGGPNPRRGNGAGWGGPAKGASTSRIDAGEAGEAIRALARDPANKSLKDEMRADLWARLHHIALNGETETVQVTAADKLLDRIDGKATVGKPDDDGRQVSKIEYAWATDAKPDA